VIDAMCVSVYNHPQKVEPQAKRGVMYAVVVISIMFGAVIVMVKKADKEMTTFSGSSSRVGPNPPPRTGSVTEGHFSRLKLIKR
jgi:hypothetical protein